MLVIGLLSNINLLDIQEYYIPNYERKTFLHGSVCYLSFLKVLRIFGAAFIKRNDVTLVIIP